MFLIKKNNWLGDQGIKCNKQQEMDFTYYRWQIVYSMWLIIQCAASYFKAIHHGNGRLDFMETNRKWNKRCIKFGFRKYMWFLSLVPKFVKNKEFRYQLSILRLNPMRFCFEHEILDYSRLVFEKIG